MSIVQSSWHQVVSQSWHQVDSQQTQGCHRPNLAYLRKGPTQSKVNTDGWKTDATLVNRRLHNKMCKILPFVWHSDPLWDTLKEKGRTRSRSGFWWMYKFFVSDLSCPFSKDSSIWPIINSPQQSVKPILGENLAKKEFWNIKGANFDPPKKSLKRWSWFCIAPFACFSCQGCKQAGSRQNKGKQIQDLI